MAEQCGLRNVENQSLSGSARRESTPGIQDRDCNSEFVDGADQSMVWIDFVIVDFVYAG